MIREDKTVLVAALRERFAKASVALVASNRGLTVEQSTRLRRALKAAGGELKVAKHTLAKRALGETRYGSLDALLRGPRGIVFGYDDPVALTKALVDFAEQNAKLEIDGGAVEGQFIAADRVKAFSEMPDLSTLRARVVQMAAAPGARVVGSMSAPARRIAGAIAALVEKLEGAGAGE